MNLFILRHGVAVELENPLDLRDADRPLTDDGRRKLRKITSAMRALDLQFDLILTSPYLRARQTAELVAKCLKSGVRLELTDALVPNGRVKKLLDLVNHLAPVDENILLVGHEPYLSELISLLLSGDPGLAITLKKGGLCKLLIEELEHGRCATLEWLLTPKQMALMGQG